MADDYSNTDPNALASFSSLLQTVDDGCLHHDLTQEVPDIIAALNNARASGTGKPKAKLTITLDFILDGDVVEVFGASKTALPKIKRERTIFWTTASNKLTRSNPKQQKLPFRDVTEGAREIRSI